ncbi:MAG: FAD-dependent oxidoreductase, partial [Atopobiaceae bacterium]|nr:FAD-dependent oxidoreductase [Atopobiaceae bacterium]
GLHTFKEELTGPEYAARYIARADELGIERRLGTMVMDISPDRIVTAVSAEAGITRIKAGAVVLAMGCRERPRGALATPGYRPAGIYSAGTAQRLVNIEGELPGREVVILGSGDIGLIMARRMTFEGAHVACVAEIMPYSGGLKRNIVQCLDDFGIPLLLSHTVTRIEGRQRVEAVWIAEVDEHMKPVPGTEVRYPCDTLLLSVGLLPENELSRDAGVELSPVTRGPIVNESLETSIPGIFACGNVLHVHDLVDYVSEEASSAGAAAARFAQGGQAASGGEISVVAKGGVRYTVPSTISPDRMKDKLTVRFRVGNVYRDRYVSVYFDDERVQHKKKRVMAPGEMEQVILKKEDLLARPDIKTITVKLEEE